MRRTAAVLMTLLAAGGARAEGVEARSRVPSTKVKIHGASSVRPAPFGLVALGGSQLRILPAGKSKWQVLHKVPEDNLYRIAVDERGRLIASWERDPDLHLFVPGTKQHLRFPKPTAPSPEFKYGYNLNDVYFTADGAAAIVYMVGYLGGVKFGNVGYHYPLDGKTPPTELFRQNGYDLHTSARSAVFAYAKTESSACEHNSCRPLGAIVGYQVDGAQATRRILLEGGEQMSRVFPVWGSSAEQVGVVVEESPRKRHLVRWRPGSERSEVRTVTQGPTTSDPDGIWLTRTGDVVEAWLTKDRGLELRRHPASGETQVITLPPQPKKTPNDKPDFALYSLKERKNGELFLHRGDFLYLLPAAGPPRILPWASLSLSGEWAGAAIYVAEPEALWIGIESPRGGRDFTYVPFAEIDKRARPLP